MDISEFISNPVHRPADGEIEGNIANHPRPHDGEFGRRIFLDLVLDGGKPMTINVHPMQLRRCIDVWGKETQSWIGKKLIATPIKRTVKDGKEVIAWELTPS